MSRLVPAAAVAMLVGAPLVMQSLISEDGTLEAAAVGLALLGVVAPLAAWHGAQRSSDDAGLAPFITLVVAYVLSVAAWLLIAAFVAFAMLLGSFTEAAPD